MRTDAFDNVNSQIVNFSKNVFDEWKNNCDDLIFSLSQNNYCCDEVLSQAQDQLQIFSGISICSGSLSFKILNLLTFNAVVGFMFHLQNINEIQGKKAISVNLLKTSLKELLLKSKIENKEIKQERNNYLSDAEAILSQRNTKSQNPILDKLQTNINPMRRSQTMNDKIVISLNKKNYNEKIISSNIMVSMFNSEDDASQIFKPKKNTTTAIRNLPSNESNERSVK